MSENIQRDSMPSFPEKHLAVFAAVNVLMFLEYQQSLNALIAHNLAVCLIRPWHSGEVRSPLYHHWFWYLLFFLHCPANLIFIASHPALTSLSF